MKTIAWSILIALGFAPLASGCAALSLFSTTHEHHHECTPALQRRVEELEQRINVLEQPTSHLGTSSTGPSLSSRYDVDSSTDEPLDPPFGSRKTR